MYLYMGGHRNDWNHESYEPTHWRAMMWQKLESAGRCSRWPQKDSPVFDTSHFDAFRSNPQSIPPQSCWAFIGLRCWGVLASC